MASSSSGPKQDDRLSSDEKDGGKKEDRTSLVEYFGSSSDPCGYCKKSAKQNGVGKRSHNLNTYLLAVADYQDMLDTNWRRSGNFCYNPINQTTCCPNYPIICKALDHQLSRSQRKCIRTVNSFLLTGEPKSSLKLDYGADVARSTSPTGTKARSYDEIKLSPKAKSRRFVKACERKVISSNITHDEAIQQVREKWLRRCQPATQLTLEDYLYPKRSAAAETTCKLPKPKHNLTIEMHQVDCKRSRDLREAEHSVMVRYQRQVHKETSKEWDMSRYCDFLVVSPLITEPLTNYDYLEHASAASRPDSDKFSADVELDNASSYLLVRPPALPTAFGTYHCCYHLDDELIAVGVLDVLPKCITTVYFFYEPTYAFLNLGIYSALVEISMVRRMNERVLDKSLGNPLTDYYLGFYVHECKKMRYKTTFRPSYLLCSKTHQYVPTEVCLEKLRDRKYADFADSEASEAADQQAEFEVKKLLQIQIEHQIDLPDKDLTTYIASLQYNLGAKYAELFVNGWLVPYAKIIGDKLLTRLRLKLDGIHKHLLARHERLTSAGLNQTASSGQTSRSGKLR